MTVAKLNRRLTLEAAERIADGAGGFSESWVALGVVWAEIKAGRGRLRGQGEVSLSEVPAEITVRGAPVGAASRPVAEQRFREGSRVWRIVAVSEADPVGRFLLCRAIEEAAA